MSDVLYEAHQLVGIGAVLFVGAVVQGAVGFASGLLAIPILVLAGFPLPEAATVNVVSTAFQNTAGAWRLRRALEPRELALPVVARWLGIPLGVTALAATRDVDPVHIKQLVGVLLLAIVVVLNVVRIEPREFLGWTATGMAFLISGFMLGFASIGGAAMVLYVNTLRWSAEKCRAFLFCCSATGVPVIAVLLGWRFGASLLSPACSTLVCLPLIVAGLTVGLRLGDRLDKALFRRLTMVLLAVLALSAIAAPWLQSR